SNTLAVSPWLIITERLRKASRNKLTTVTDLFQQPSKRDFCPQSEHHVSFYSLLQSGWLGPDGKPDPALAPRLALAGLARRGMRWERVARRWRGSRTRPCVFGPRWDGPERREAHFETAPFDASAPFRAIRRGR